MRFYPHPLPPDVLKQIGRSLVAPEDEASPAEVDPPTLTSGGQAADLAPPQAGDPAATFGRYVLVRELGKGGCGQVHLAYDPVLKRHVALKRMNPAGASQWATARFVREAQVAARVRHPHLVTLHDAGIEGGVPYFTMEYLEGTPMRFVPGRTLRQTVQAVREACLAAHALHEQGVVHRDIKPSNIILCSDGRAVLCDLGLARTVTLEDRVTFTGEILGTPAYMAPEQVNGLASELGARTDIYGLGATLYELATGRLPFGESNALAAILTREPDLPRKIVPDLSPDLEAVIVKAMAKEEDRRYATALDMADDLDRWLGGLPVKASRMTGLRRWALRVRFYRSRLAVAVALAVLLGLSGGLAWHSWRTREADRRFSEGSEALDAANACDLRSVKRRRDLLIQADDRLTRGLLLRPDHREGRLDRGKVRCSLRLYPEALKDFDLLLTRNPNDGSANLWKAKTLLRLRYEEWQTGTSERSSVERMKSFLLKLQNLADASDELASYRASIPIFIQFEGEGTNAEVLKQIDRLPPQDRTAEVLTLAGFLVIEEEIQVAPTIRADAYVRALTYFEEALKRDRWMEAALIGQIEPLLYLSRIQEAAAVLSDVRRIRGDSDVVIQFKEGYLLFAQRNWEEASRQWARLARQDPIRLLEGSWATFQRDSFAPWQARRILEQADLESPLEPQTRYVLGCVLLRLSRFDPSLRQLALDQVLACIRSGLDDPRTLANFATFQDPSVRGNPLFGTWHFPPFALRLVRSDPLLEPLREHAQEWAEVEQALQEQERRSADAPTPH